VKTPEQLSRVQETPGRVEGWREKMTVGRKICQPQKKKGGMSEWKKMQAEGVEDHNKKSDTGSVI
jgi:hypothetical protein